MTYSVDETDSGTKGKLATALETMRKDYSSGIIVSSELTKVWNKIKDDAIALCPKDTGALSRTIKVVNANGMTGNWSRIKDVTVFDKTITAGDLSTINPKTKRPVDYGTWVHDGHAMANGGYYMGVPFLSMAIFMNSEELDAAIDRALKKIGKKFTDGKK